MNTGFVLKPYALRCNDLRSKSGELKLMKFFYLRLVLSVLERGTSRNNALGQTLNINHWMQGFSELEDYVERKRRGLRRRILQY